MNRINADTVFLFIKRRFFVIVPALIGVLAISVLTVSAGSGPVPAPAPTLPPASPAWWGDANLERLKQDLATGTLVPEARANLQAKIAQMESDRMTQLNARASAAAGTPTGEAEKLASMWAEVTARAQIPRPTPEPFHGTPAGNGELYPGGGGAFPGSGLAICNFWDGHDSGGTFVRVYAGFDTQHSFVRFQVGPDVSTGSGPPKRTYIDIQAPSDHGALCIVAIAGALVSLIGSDGSTLTFNVDSRAFVGGVGTPIPTATIGAASSRAAP